MKKRLRNLKTNQGFSFTELLVATIIMMLATGLLTQTLDLAIDQFYRSTQESEAQLLCSDLSRFVEDELTFAKYDATEIDGAAPKKYSGGTHNMSSEIWFYIGTPVYADGEDAGFTKGEVTDYTGTGAESKPVPVGTSTDTYGHILLSSPSYSQYVLGDSYDGKTEKYYDIAGTGSYRVGSISGTSTRTAHNLKANMTLTPPTDASGSFVVSITVKDIDDNNSSNKYLAKNTFKVRPLQVTNTSD